jgi:hypothetical protein
MQFDDVKTVWKDGELLPWAAANIHVSSHALHYGSGVFEGSATRPIAPAASASRITSTASSPAPRTGSRFAHAERARRRGLPDHRRE